MRVIEAMKMENEITAHKAGHGRRAADRRRRVGRHRRHARRDQLGERVADVLRVDPRCWAFVRRPGGQRRLGALLARARSGRRRPRSSTSVAVAALAAAAVPGHDRLRPLDERPQPLERRQVGLGRSARRDPRDLDRRQVVAAHEHARATGSRTRSRRRCGRRRDAARARARAPEPIDEPPGTGQRLDPGERQRPAVVDVVLLVELAQLALGLPRLGRQPPRRALAAPERGLREREAAEQVVPVARGWRAAPTPGSRPARATPGSASSSSG